MRFRTDSTSPPHLNPRLQRRMMGYVAIIAVVMIAFQLFSAKRPAIDPAQPAAGAKRNPADEQVRDAVNRPLDADEFFSEPTPDVERLAATPRPQGDDISIDPQMLALVEDNTLGIRRTEAPAFFYVLDKARQVPAGRLQRAAEKGVQRLNLMSDPTLYRGKPVTIVGTMRRLHEFPAIDNDYGLKTLYEAWIFTVDSPERPFRVVSSGLGPQLAAGDPQKLPAEVRVTGYFFKREGFDSPGGLQVAPTILASRIEPYISENAPPPADGLVPILLAVIVAVSLILSTTLLSFAWSDRRTPPRLRKLPDLSAKTNEQLAALDLRSVRDQLRELEERERYGDWYPSPSDLNTVKHSTNGHVQAESGSVDLPTPPPPTRMPRTTEFDDEQK